MYFLILFENYVGRYIRCADTIIDVTVIKPKLLEIFLKRVKRGGGRLWYNINFMFSSEHVFIGETISDSLQNSPI